MTLKEQILKEHSKNNMLAIAAIVGNDRKKFQVVLDMMLGDNIRAQQLSAAVYYHCLKSNPWWLDDHLDLLLNKIEKDKIHDAVRRNIFRILQNGAIPEDLQGRIYNLCMSYVMDPKEVIAVRAFSMSTLHNICKSEPELSRELSIVVTEAMKCGRAAITIRGRKILKDIEKNIKD